MSNPYARARTARTLFVLSFSLACLALPAAAHAKVLRPDSHAPSGVMYDHMHEAGEWMIGLRSMSSWQSGKILSGKDEASDATLVAAGFSTAPSSMTMHMIMLDLMYAPTDWLNLMVMPQYVTMHMAMRALPGAMGGGHDHGAAHHEHGNDGFGDTVIAALLRLFDGDVHHVHAGVGLSMPTGSVTETGADGRATHYGMQVGSGTWDFIPSLTYTGHAARWGWGAQVAGTLRLDSRNEAGFRFGDQLAATAWGSYRLTDWLSASLRLQHTRQGDIEGHYNLPHSHASPPDLQANYGGRWLEMGFGLNAVVPEGRFGGNRFSVEWLEPVMQDVNGFQLKRSGTLHLGWSLAF